MLKGKSLIELATAITEQVSRKVDHVVDTRKIEFVAEQSIIDTTTLDGPSTTTPQHPAKPVLVLDGSHAVDMTPHALGQLTEYVGIPARYAQRMLEQQPQLLASNVNTWLRHDEPSKRLVRELKPTSGAGRNIARAFLSNRYHRMENDVLLGAILPELAAEQENGLIVIQSTELTEYRMYLKVTFPKLRGEVRKGDVVEYGFILRNSEIGAGAMDVSPFVNRLVCLNGMTISKDVDNTRMRRAHLGRALEEGVDYYTEETVRADDEALALKLRDTLRAMRDPSRWEAVLGKMRAVAETENAADPVKAVERVTEMLTLSKPEANQVLLNFIAGRDLTQWGMLNAVTAVANEHESYDRASELEVAGGRILSLPASDWHRIAKAA